MTTIIILNDIDGQIFSFLELNFEYQIQNTSLQLYQDEKSIYILTEFQRPSSKGYLTQELYHLHKLQGPQATRVEKESAYQVSKKRSYFSDVILSPDSLISQIFSSEWPLPFSSLSAYILDLRMILSFLQYPS
ncbi:unnamed protein product [Paramecium primaurelia]|uniref:Uncharacterized protein n=1 Tax=Paramecium primaurelia TaxID=5886 RepID=A0A8S1QPH8_PARPR|nr:unnamed protein product [Paramecium primaurelia]CAD8117713.1 unnamed protein product [Paramecium primaurelia]